MLTLAGVFGITLVAFLLVIACMAVGVLLGRREISGSCGGLGGQNGDSGADSCSLCSNPDAACRELGRRMQQTAPTKRSNCDQDCELTGCSQEKIDACNQP